MYSEFPSRFQSTHSLNLLARAGGSTTEVSLHLVQRRDIRRIRRRKTAKKDEENENDDAEDDELAESGVADAVLGPLAAGFVTVFLELLSAELVVDETGESDGVTEELEAGNGSAPDHHGGSDEEDILEDTAESKDEDGSLADLEDC